MQIVDISQKKNEVYGIKNDYLTNLYPENHFDFHLDIGARGVKNPWHMHFLSHRSPSTMHIGYECDIPYYQEIQDIITNEQLENAKMYSEGFGDGSEIQTPQGKSKTITLKEIVERDDLNLDNTWCFKMDCEGCEYSMFGDTDTENILKKADHIALETHYGSVIQRTNNFWHRVNEYPTESLVETWMTDVFSDTHKIFVMDDQKSLGLNTHVLISNETYENANDLFWKNLL